MCMFMCTALPYLQCGRAMCGAKVASAALPTAAPVVHALHSPVETRSAGVL